MPDTIEKPQATQQRPSHRTRNVVLSVVGVLVAIPVLAILILLTFDWNRAKPWLNDKVSDAIERPFAIRGNLAVHWEQPARAMAPQARTWRDWVPWPHLYADDVHIGNPEWMAQRDMASVRQFSFSLNPFGLLGHQISVPVLRFDGPQAELLRTDETHNNWTFKREQKPSKWQLDVQRIVLSKGVLLVDDAVSKTKVTANINTLDNDPTYGIAWTVTGSYNGAPVGGGGKAGAVLSLENQGAPFPIQADMHSGPNRIALEGTVTRPAALEAIDLRLKLAGASMARLYVFTHVLLPETPQFSTEGHLVGKLGKGNSRWTYSDFKGKVGSSDISGNLTFQTGKPRPLLTATVVSHELLFSDLGPAIGADSNASKEKRGVAPVQPAGKKLPVERFHTERWKALDADVHFRGDRIIRNKNLPLTKLSTHLIMKDGVLTLAPLDFGFAGGLLRNTVKLDGNSDKSIKVNAEVQARHLQIKQMFPAVQNIRQATIGELNGDAKLSAVGDSVAEMLAHSNGELKTLVEQGTVSKLLMEEMGLNIGSIIVTKLFGDRTVQLNCMASDFDISDGVLKTQTFIADTDEAVVQVKGTVNLQTEQMDMTLDPKTKGLRLFSLRSPLYLRGTFAKPDVGIDKKVLALKAGSALALGTIAAPAALIPLINTGPGKDSNCARLLSLASTPPKAPPPGVTKKH
ncbi:AsmA family protein [Massilia terrae]|uniref:AsmA family protein n=1 Tax=Massilia terrae TaxID=1811224 RepID=A0ABT2D1V3_9BURK|nr:AsmA family protein [Massilia terrae]MCS0660225.1 AsmA family protein [Massilia terrae]